MSEKFLSRDEVFAANDIGQKDIYVKEWKGTVTIRGMTAEERDEYEASMITMERKGKRINAKTNMENARAKLVARCVIVKDSATRTEDCTPVFTIKDVKALGRKSAIPIKLLSDEIQELSGMNTETDEEESEDDAAENFSGKTPSGE